MDAARAAFKALPAQCRKLDFVADALGSSIPFQPDSVDVCPRVAAAIKRRAGHTAGEANLFRVAATDGIVERGKCLRASGACDAWFGNADHATRMVAGNFNGPLAMEIATKIGYHDPAFVELFRTGGSVVGQLAASGSGVPRKFRDAAPVGELWQSCGERNRKLIESLRVNVHADVLLRELSQEAAAGRMTSPIPIEEVDLDSSVIARRFGVEQGSDQGGTFKLRSVDDETASGVNPCLQPEEGPVYDGLDVLVAVVALSYACGLRNLGFWKADIKRAFRRIPVRPDQRWLLWVVVCGTSGAVAARHNAMPFGCTGSVHAWDRVGNFLSTLAVELLMLPLCRCVAVASRACA